MSKNILKHSLIVLLTHIPPCQVLLGQEFPAVVVLNPLFLPFCSIYTCHFCNQAFFTALLPQFWNILQIIRKNNPLIWPQVQTLAQLLVTTTLPFPCL